MAPELQMPFVTVRSAGGPHDDASYVAGWEMGALDRELAATRPRTLDRPVHADSVGQVDLIAMRHGYITQVVETSDEWAHITLTRPQDPAWSGRHPSVAHFESLFAFEHLPEHLQRVSRPFAAAAVAMLGHCQDGIELSAALRRLVEAKDCAVRQAVIDHRAASG